MEPHVPYRRPCDSPHIVYWAVTIPYYSILFLVLSCDTGIGWLVGVLVGIRVLAE